MFWISVVAAIIPPMAFYRFVTRDGDDITSGLIYAMVVFIIQAILLVVGGWIAGGVAALIFGFSVFLLYGLWKLSRIGPGKKGGGAYRSPTAAGKSIVHGKKLDVIRFDYRNAKGELAARRVNVTTVGQWQFEGIDLAKRAERTFRYDRVVGEITSELTGEVLSPGEWAVSIIGQSV